MVTHIVITALHDLDGLSICSRLHSLDSKKNIFSFIFSGQPLLSSDHFKNDM